MELLIYPMYYVSLTQREYGNYSHKNIPAIDINGLDGSSSPAYAPCTMRVLNINKGGSHTIFFGSCDEFGNIAKVKLANGMVTPVTIAMTHIDDISMFSVGKIFKRGTYCYQEGTYMNGKSGQVGNHIHIEIGIGHIKSKSYVTIDGQKYLRFKPDVALKPTECFYLLKGTNELRGGSYSDGIEWKWVKNREDNDMKLKMKCTNGQQAIREKISFDGAKPNGKILEILPKGNTECEIIGFIDGIKADGYQWVQVKHGNLHGYAQWDSRWFEVYEY